MNTKMTTEDFISLVGPAIISECKTRGYNYPSAIIAQAILESGSGNSKLAEMYHNYFGMKCGSSWTGRSVNMATKEEYVAGTLKNIRDNFRAYDSMEAGIKGYFDFIGTKRYNCLKYATSSRDYIEMIKDCGYATSSDYVKNVWAVVVKYNLQAYDCNFKVNTVYAPTPTLRYGDHNQEVAVLQKALNALFSAHLDVDGKYGPATKRAVQRFQAACGLHADGIYGPLSSQNLTTLLAGMR